MCNAGRGERRLAALGSFSMRLQGGRASLLLKVGKKNGLNRETKRRTTPLVPPASLSWKKAARPIGLARSGGCDALAWDDGIWQAAADLFGWSRVSIQVTAGVHLTSSSTPAQCLVVSCRSAPNHQGSLPASSVDLRRHCIITLSTGNVILPLKPSLMLIRFPKMHVLVHSIGV